MGEIKPVEFLKNLGETAVNSRFAIKCRQRVTIGFGVF